MSGQKQQQEQMPQQITYKELIDEIVEQGDESDAEFTLETEEMFFANSTF